MPSGSLPLVTIIIRSYNYGRFLAEAIESALAQTYRPLEVIVIDDGSTDDSVAVATRYTDRVRLIRQVNAGVERASNRAVREARGTYVSFLDADDVLAPTHVEELWRALRGSPDAAYAYCRPRFFGAREGAMRCLPFSAYFLVKRTNFVHPTALLRIDDFLAAGGFSGDLGRHALEDWDLWLKLLRAGKRGTYVRRTLVGWRRHAGGSRNPEHGPHARQAVAHVRGRHRDLVDAMDDWRGRVFYGVDLVTAAADLVFGFSRWPRVVRSLERRSWSRYQRWHAQRAG